MQISIFDDETLEYAVREIPAQETYDLILKKHYAHRIPSISHSYALLRFGELAGIVTFGIPPSMTLLRGVCGDEYWELVLELNRLVLVDNQKNEASRLVAGALRLLPKPRIIVSYADGAQNHTGYVYQATNFLYTGVSKKFVDIRIKGLEHQHHSTATRGLTHEQVKQKFGAENVFFEVRSPKHRYVTFVGDRKQCKEFRRALKYPVLPFPKVKAA